MKPRHSTTARLRPIMLGMLATALLGSPIHAQSRPIVVAMPDAFPAIDARAVVLRTADRDVVLLRSDDATADVLAVSLLALRDARERRPSPNDGEMIPITGFARQGPGDDGAQRGLASVIDRLERQPTTTVGDLGPGRWIRYRGR